MFDSIFSFHPILCSSLGNMVFPNLQIFYLKKRLILVFYVFFFFVVRLVGWLVGFLKNGSIYKPSTGDFSFPSRTSLDDL